MLVVILPICCSVVALFISWRMLQIAKDNNALSNAKIEKFESNCIATLNAKVAEIEKDLTNQRLDIAKIFDKIETIKSDLEYMKGKFNGKA